MYERLAIATLVTLLPAAVSAQVVEYYHLDLIGNVRAVTSQTGAHVERHDYLPFGEEWNVQPGTQPKRFTGKERDAETGFDYFGARYYGQKIGRFTTIDPVYTWRENLEDPQRWNRYAYVRNNPLRYVDPDGRELAIAIYYSGLTRQTAQAVATMVTQNFTEAGVKNVTFELTEGSPSLLTTILYVLPTDSHLLTLRADYEGRPSVPDTKAGDNWGGRSAVVASWVRQRTDDPDQFILGLANLATHEVAHDALPGLQFHTLTHDFMKDGGAREDRWLFDPNLGFTADQAKRLQRKHNDWWGEEQRGGGGGGW
jgi:RHS repeat-associated protein